MEQTASKIDMTKIKDFLKKYSFYIVCFLCLIVSVSGIWSRPYILIVYLATLLFGIVFYDINKIIVLLSFVLFFRHQYSYCAAVIVISIALLAVCIKMIVLKKCKFTKDFILPFIIIIVLAVIYFTNNFNAENWMAVYDVILPMFIVLEFFLLKGKLDTNKIVKGLVIIFILSAITAFLSYHIGIYPEAYSIDSKGIFRFKGFLGHENSLAIYCSVMLMITLLQHIRRKISLFDFVCFEILLSVVGVLTKSKVFLVCLVLVALVYLVWVYIKNWKTGLAQTIVLISVLGLCFVIIPDKTIQYFQRFVLYSKDGGFFNMILTGRVEYWEKYIKIWVESPISIIFGKGITYDCGILKSPHNTFIHFLTYYGLFGFILISLFSVYIIIKSFNVRKRSFVDFFPIIMIFLIMLIEVFVKDRSVILILILSISLTSEKRDKDSLSKVLFYNSTLNLAGTEKYMLNVIENTKDKFNFDILIQSKRDVDVNVLRKSKELADNVYFVGDGKLMFFVNILKFFVSHAGKYDVIHINATRRSIGVVAFFARLFSYSNIIIFHSHMGGSDNKNNKIVSFVGGFLAKTCSTNCVACSNYAANFMYGEKYTKKHDVTILNNSIDISKFSFDKKTRDKYRKQLGIENKYVLLHVGRFAKQKNHEKLIDVFNQIYKKNPNSVLLLVGDGKLKEQIVDKVKKYNLDDSVRFLGLLDNVNNIMQAADVFVMTSFHEGLPISAVEAQASGLPLVLSKNISSETNLTGNCIFVDIESDDKKWADIILKLQNFERKKVDDIFIEKKFENNSAMKEIEKLYQ